MRYIEDFDLINPNKMKKIIPAMIIAALLAGCNTQKNVVNVEQWDVFEVVFTGPSDGNPYMEVDLSATFSKGETSLKVPGFYDGDDVYRIRFSPGETGDWSYVTESSAEELNGQVGSFRCIPPDVDNHGPLRIVNTFYLQYADGTPFYSVGTTAYQWTSVKQSIQEKTLETLSEAPFNKIRMCVFPKHYRYGNETEPWIHPYTLKDGERDYTSLQVEFFQNFDLRVEQLLEMGIQADVILFHPYDEAWGYYLMGHELNERYVRYMIARISAYRNVWWSLANEWDVPEIKEAIDWEGIGTQLQNEDPHNRFRGIHNWYGSEDHFYDHTRPWITHTCTQTHEFHNAIRWREMYHKPLLFDEMRYEGDVSSSWGNMSGEEMTSYFWMAGLSGGYPTHGDTYVNQADDSTEVRWWGKGGLLVGESPERIAFFRTVMEQAPVFEMTPAFSDQGEPWNRGTNIHTFVKEGDYYMAYVADSAQVIELNLSGESDYTMEVLDTWNMEVLEKRIVEPGVFTYETPAPYTALVIRH